MRGRKRLAGDEKIQGFPGARTVGEIQAAVSPRSESGAAGLPAGENSGILRNGGAGVVLSFQRRIDSEQVAEIVHDMRED